MRDRLVAGAKMNIRQFTGKTKEEFVADEMKHLTSQIAWPLRLSINRRMSVPRVELLQLNLRPFLPTCLDK